MEGRPGDWGNWTDMRWDPSLRYLYCDGGCWHSTLEGEYVRLDKFGGQTEGSGASFDYETNIAAGGWLMLTVESNGNTDYDHTVFDMTIWQLP